MSRAVVQPWPLASRPGVDHARPAGPAAASSSLRAVSVTELQAALRAVRRGDFVTLAPPGGDTSSGPDGVTGRRLGGGDDGVGVPGGGVLLRVTPVVAAHPGAGASTVALAIAEAAVAAGGPVRLIECADPAGSGLAAAAGVELGVSDAGWRRGRRGVLAVDRLARPVTAPGDVVPPAVTAAPDGGEQLLVVDVGWPVAAVLASPGRLGDLLAAGGAVVVCRVTVPGVRRVEQVLGRLPRPVVVAAVGPARWPGVVRASAGPALRALRGAGRVVSVPVDRRLEITGLTAAALPRSVLAAGRALTVALAGPADGCSTELPNGDGLRGETSR